MSLVEDDPLAVLPVLAAAASAAFARATDTTRGADERRLQLEALTGALVEAGRLLERGTSVVARLSAELEQSQQRTHPAGCPGTPPVCPLCLGVALTPSGGIAVCLRCERVQGLPPGEFRCAEPASVTMGGTTAEPRFLRRSHAAHRAAGGRPPAGRARVQVGSSGARRGGPTQRRGRDSRPGTHGRGRDA